MQARNHTASVVAHGLQGLPTKEQVGTAVGLKVQQQLTQSEHLRGLVSKDEMVSVIRHELNNTLIDPELTERICSVSSFSRHGFPSRPTLETHHC
jgi:hypothetical protein